MNRHFNWCLLALLTLFFQSMDASAADQTQLGVWAAEGFENWTKNFDLSERLRLHYLEVAKGSSTPKNIGF